LQTDPVEGDPRTLALMRLSAVAADLALAAVAWRLTTSTKSAKGARTARATATSPSPSRSSPPPWVPFLLVFASPGLLIVDSIHFQYNAPLLALLLLAVSAAQRRRGDLAAAAAFAALVCSKHLFACLGPLFALHLLGRCLGRGRAALDAGGGVAAAVAASASLATPLAAVVAAVVAVAFGPFALSMPSLAPLLGRLFPFGRGLLHAYWAANAWALVAGADVALSAALRALAPRVGALPLPAAIKATAAARASSSLLSSLAGRRGSGLASGLVQQTEFAVLPTPGAGTAALCVLLAQAPALLSALRSGFASASAPGRRGGRSPPPPPARTPSFAAAAQYCLLCSFVWGYHVHEKAILPVLALAAWRAFGESDEGGEEEEEEEEERDGNGNGDDGDDGNGNDGRGIARGPRAYFRLSLPALHALLPLLAPAPAERATAFLLLVAHALFLFSEAIGGVSPPFSPLERAAAVFLGSLEVACVAAWPLALPRLAARLPFAPLALTSLVCAVGVCGCWLADALRWWRVALMGGGGGGGRGRNEDKEETKSAAAATSKEAVAATAAASTRKAKTATSASPSLAARRPRRAAPAAAKA